MALAVVVLVSLADYFLDSFLMYAGVWQRGYVTALGSTLTGLLAGGLFLYVARREKAHRELVRARVEMIADLNHHIRNALQVIKLCGTQTESSFDSRQLQLIKESADRIEWALREVLPKYPVDEKDIKRQPPVGYAAESSTVQEIPAFSERRRIVRLS